MIVYFLGMRTRDDKKIDALFEATVKTVNEIGFAASSVSKIAKEAGVSPATIYIYYKNKEDLLVSTYTAVKIRLSRAMLKDFDDTLPIRDILKNAWFNMFSFISQNMAYYRFAEQFSNSPYHTLVDKQEIEQFFEPFFKIMLQGIEQKIIKNVDMDILAAYIFHPITILANPNLCQNFTVTKENINIAFNLAWDAIKL